MRKLIVLSFITLDGVMQAPGAPEEDTSGGFSFGGWTVPYFDEELGKVMNEQMGHPFNLLLGRKTYDIFAAYWPEHTGVIPMLDQAHKFVASRSKRELSWANSTLLEGGVVEAVKKLKDDFGPEIQVHGSGNLIQTLLKHDLVDELWLKIFPITLGTGKRLFESGTIPASFSLTGCRATTKGVVVVNYVRAGKLETGSFIEEA